MSLIEPVYYETTKVPKYFCIYFNLLDSGMKLHNKGPQLKAYIHTCNYFIWVILILIYDVDSSFKNHCINFHSKCITQEFPIHVNTYCNSMIWILWNNNKIVSEYFQFGWFPRLKITCHDVAAIWEYAVQYWNAAIRGNIFVNKKINLQKSTKINRLQYPHVRSWSNANTNYLFHHLAAHHHYHCHHYVIMLNTPMIICALIIFKHH